MGVSCSAQSRRRAAVSARRASSRSRSLLDRRGNTVVGVGVNGRCELPRASFRILEQLGETGMDRSATHRVGGLQRTGGEKRVCEPDAIAVRLDDACLERRR